MRTTHPMIELAQIVLAGRDGNQFVRAVTTTERNLSDATVERDILVKEASAGSTSRADRKTLISRLDNRIQELGIHHQNAFQAMRTAVQRRLIDRKSNGLWNAAEQIASGKNARVQKAVHSALKDVANQQLAALRAERDERKSRAIFLNPRSNFLLSKAVPDGNCSTVYLKNQWVAGVERNDHRLREVAFKLVADGHEYPWKGRGATVSTDDGREWKVSYLKDEAHDLRMLVISSPRKSGSGSDRYLLWVAQGSELPHNTNRYGEIADRVGKTFRDQYNIKARS